MENRKKVYVYTDGSCSGNPGPGGWGCILKYNSVEKELCGGDKNTTNNRMEMTAVIEALKALKEPCDVELYTDSQYICNSINNEWVFSWKNNGWKKADKKPALNIELWEEILKLIELHNVKFNWIKGHAGHPENERCDKLAVEQTAIYSE
ncbi:MAG: ribonuclease HI [Clostridia bacterium]|nr:ribonuclease HI [Clostridia bacterium]